MSCVAFCNAGFDDSGGLLVFSSVKLWRMLCRRTGLEWNVQYQIILIPFSWVDMDFMDP